MSTLTWTQIFKNLEGEGPHSGYPTIYIRLSKCNFKCSGFNNPTNNITSKGYATLDFDPTTKSTLMDIEPISVGCDTQYAVNPDFKHIWRTGTSEELATETVDLLPNKTWIHPKSGIPFMLSITGGEPTLQHKNIPALLNTKQFDTLQHVLFETNCAVPLPDKFIQELNDWTNAKPNRLITWSNSPKLSSSGERWDRAINPKVANQQNKVLKSNQYFKFVCPPKQQAFDEVQKAMQQYWDAGIPKTHNIFVMPECCTEEQQVSVMTEVADMCIENGVIYCHRIHNTVYANAIDK